MMSFDSFKKDVSPVFIFGNNRGGTTLMSRIINFHPLILRMPQNTYFFTHYWDLRKQIPNKASLKILCQSSELYVKDKPFERPSGKEYELMKHLYKLVTLGDPVNIFSFLAYIVYSINSNGKEVRFWAERTNNHIYRYKELKAMFPNCKFIIPIRDPRGVITSELGHAKKNEKLSFNSLEYCQHASFNWNRIIKLANKIKNEYPTDTYISKYELFVVDPIRSIKKIFDFLYLPQLQTAEIEEKVLNLGEIYESNAGIRRKSGIDSRSINKWTEILSDDEKYIINRLTNSVAIKVGYDYKESELNNLKIYFKLNSERYKNYFRRICKLFYRHIVRILRSTTY